jgi:NADH-quinone oxidoreductase subunit M
MFVAATFASIGLPGFANFWGEFAIFVSLWHYEPWVLVPAAAGIVISAIYGLRAVSWIFFGKPSETLREHWKETSVGDLKPGERLSASLLFSGLLIVGFFPRIFSDYIDMDLKPFEADRPAVAVEAVESAPARAGEAVVSRLPGGGEGGS